MKTNVIIVHGSPSEKEKAMSPEKRTYDKHWMPWLKEQLNRKKIKCEIPLMPEPWEPDYKFWKKEFEKIKVDEDSVLIWHSAGTTFLVRWLGETKKKIKKLILIAPWKIVWKNSSLNKDFCNYEIDKEIKNRVNEIIIFTSDDEEEEDGKISVKIFNNILDGRVIELKNHGHFTFGDMKTKEFPELLEKVLE